MLRTLVLMAVLVGLVGFLGRQAFADPKHDGDTVLGARWHFTIKSGAKEIHGDFRVLNGDVYVGTKKIGNTRGMDFDDVVMTFGGYDDLNGKAILKKVMKKPATFRGTLHKTDKTEWDMFVRVMDR